MEFDKAGMVEGLSRGPGLKSRCVMQGAALKREVMAERSDLFENKGGRLRVR